ncbi:MAG: CaiB/BaiF CoA-transferase family protein [Planctomycetota bacterium]
MRKPLEGITVLEFCQYLAGPWAGLRLADYGARVIKVERPGTGDACRQLATKNIRVDGDSLVFHTVNRGKASFAANLKDPDDLAEVQKLIAGADVLTHNFRPGVMEKVGLDYPSVKEINPGLVYASVTGYGPEGPWRGKPGQDLLAQSLSGLLYLSGRADAAPTPMGSAVADGICGVHLTQGILAALVRRGRTGQGALVEVSLLASLIDMQFEALTTYLNDGGRAPRRSAVSASHPYQGAPYGIYATQDGFLALAMGPLDRLGQLLDLPEVSAFDNAPDAFAKADDIRVMLADRLKSQTTDHWLSILEPADVWCGRVMGYDELREHPGYQALEIEQTVTRDGAPPVRTLRSPVRFNGERLFCDSAAPRIGRDNDTLRAELADA